MPESTERKLYIITKGSFAYQSYNKKTFQNSGANKFKLRAHTTLTNVRKAVTSNDSNDDN